MSRTAKGAKNVGITLIFYIISMFLAFYSRKIFINHLGEDFMGLSTTILNLLGFLNLAELGVTSAIATALYKPLFDDNKKEINDLISIFNYLYHIIGYVILVVGVVLLFFAPVFFEKAVGVSTFEIYASYLVLFVAMLVSYFISYKQLLLTADQRDYVIAIWTKTFNVVKVLCQILALVWFDWGYISWLILELIFGVSYGFLINHKVNRTYPWLCHSFVAGRIVIGQYKEIFKKIRQIIPHRISGFVLAQTDNIVLYTVTSSLAIVTSYNNYVILIGSAVMIFTVSSNGLYAGVGNIVAQGDQKAIQRLFNELMALYFFLGGMLTIAIGFLTEPFVTLWLGQEFVLEPLIFHLILFNTVIAIFRLPIEMFLNGYILYKDTWAPITEAVLNLVISITLGLKFGLLGIVMGTTVSLIVIVCIWRPIFLYREGFKSSVWPFVKQLIVYIVCMAVTFSGVEFFASSSIMCNSENYLCFFVNASILIITTMVIYGMLMYVCSQSMRNLTKRIYIIIRSNFR